MVLDSQGKVTLLSLQYLISRAAQKDSLNWWEDDSLTQAGGYLLERLFPTNPKEAGLKLALEAAKTRYQAAFQGENAALHLFRLDKTGEIEHSLIRSRLTDIPVSLEPIGSIETLRQKLFDLTGPSPTYQVLGEHANHRVEIRLDPSIKPTNLTIAQALTWACLEGIPGKPVFPYITG
jgi:hypothetical protein